jgi:UDP-N-acetylmuramoyl-L-alanyl-D-glutamate--2,6-diaminopimelate ligase
MKLLSALLEGVHVLEVQGAQQVMVEDLAIDSRAVRPDGVFIAVKGTRSDGHKFIEIAIQNGARVIICQELPEEIRTDITYVRVQNTASVSGVIAHHFYGNPTDRLSLVGITGTNGKTTVATMLYQMMQEVMGRKAGLISTIVNRVGGEEVTSTHNTPDPYSINR